MSSPSVEFGGYFDANTSGYTVVVRSCEELRGLTAIGTDGEFYYYAGTATSEHSTQMLNFFSQKEGGLTEYDMISDLVQPLGFKSQVRVQLGFPVPPLAEIAMNIATGSHQ